MIDKIIFKGYKSFKNLNELELKPITVLFGKNSSGKSAVAKLPTLIESSLSGKFKEPLVYVNRDIELGAEYRDLFYNRGIQEQMKFELFDGENKLAVQITNSVSTPLITSWELVDESIQKGGIKILSTDIVKNKGYPFEGFLMKDYLEQLKNSFKLRTDYIGPFRLNPPRVFSLKGNKNFKRIGIKGQNAYQILVQDEEVLSDVNKWFEDNFDGWGLTIKKIDSYYEIRIKQKSLKNDGVNLVDVGQGMSQALPIIVQAYQKYSQQVLKILEQPELHLHPAAHGNLAELLLASTKRDDGSKYLVETHSKNFILRLRRLVAEGKMSKDSLNLYWVDYDHDESSSMLKKIEVNALGEVDFWPEDIFNDSFEETLALRKAQKDITS